MYALFLIRRGEWLARAREREAIAASYLAPRGQLKEILARIDGWARRHFTRKKLYRDRDTNIWYGEWSALDREAGGQWQMHYTAMPFDLDTTLWVFRLEHIPLRGRIGLIDDWLHELDESLGPSLQPVILRDVVESKFAQPLAASA